MLKTLFLSSIPVMKFPLFLFISLAVFLFSCTKDKAELINGGIRVSPAYCDSMQNINRVSFKCFIEPVLRNHCTNCHARGNTLPVDFTFYDNIKTYSAGIADRIQPNPPSGKERMPLGGPYLADTIIEKIKSWVNEGANNN